MNDIGYAICVCIIGFFMWFSIGFSFIEIIFNMYIIFDSWKKIILSFIVVISFSSIMTILSYKIISSL